MAKKKESIPGEVKPKKVRAPRAKKIITQEPEQPKIEEPKVKHQTSAIQTNKNYTIVNLSGDVFVNVEGVKKAIEDKTIFNYVCLTKNKNTTLMGGPRFYMHSYLFNALNNMVKFAEEVKPGWYNTRWTIPGFPVDEGKTYNRLWNSLFYDEFLFLLGESLIEADNIQLMIESTEWEGQQHLFQTSGEDKTPEVVKPLYEAKTKAELRKAWAKLCQAYHPDVIDGDEKLIQLINITYAELLKTMTS